MEKSLFMFVCIYCIDNQVFMQYMNFWMLYMCMMYGINKRLFSAV